MMMQNITMGYRALVARPEGQFAHRRKWGQTASA